MQEQKLFMECRKCGFEWATAEQFVLDTTVKVTGYQAVFSDPAEGIYIFSHNWENCHTEFSLKVGMFAHLRTGERNHELQFLSEACEGHCFIQHDLEPCKVDCALRWPREILQYLRKHELPK